MPDNGGDAGNDGGTDSSGDNGNGGGAGSGSSNDGSNLYIDGRTGQPGQAFNPGNPSGYKNINVDDLRIYRGTTDQEPDTLIEAFEGACAPAYRGRAYFVLENLQLADYGNRLPNLTCEVFARGNADGSTDTVNRAIRLITLKSGLTDDDIELLDTDLPLRGAIIGTGTTGKGALEPFLKGFPIDIVESGYTIRVLNRNRTADAEIVGADLAAREPGSDQTKAALEITQRNELDLPREVTVVFPDPARDYQPNTARASRQVVLSKNKTQEQTVLTLSADEAKQLAERLLSESWHMRGTVSFSLPHKYIILDAGDIITVTSGTFSYTIRILNIQIGANGLLNFNGTVHSQLAYQSNATAATADTSTDLNTVRPTTLQLMDLPALRDVDDNLGFYTAAAPNAQTGIWPGAFVFRTEDGTNYSQLFTVNAATPMGVATTVLASGTSHRFDRRNTVTVRLTKGSLSSISVLEALNYGNMALIGREIVIFRTATLVDTDTYELSNLLRGRKGTEPWIADHAIGERFVVLNAATTNRYLDRTGTKDIVYAYKGVTATLSILDVTAQNFTNTNAAWRPYGPVHCSAVRSGGNVNLSWVRRARLNHEWMNGVDVPLDEDTESYEIDVLNTGFTVLRTITALTTSSVYTAAQQTTDGFVGGDTILFNFYQMSARFGRGLAGGTSI